MMIGLAGLTEWRLGDLPDAGLRQRTLVELVSITRFRLGSVLSVMCMTEMWSLRLR